jgi:glycine/D-amino acid oxidase-like deaminating enzyme
VKTADVVIAGGGIAGLATAWCLGRAGLTSVLLAEREELFATHASGRNAAIFRQLDLTAEGVALALRSRELLDELFAPAASPWLTPTGSLFVAAQPAPLERLAALAGSHRVETSWLAEAELVRRVAYLEGGHTRLALQVPGDGVMDIHAICSTLASASRRAGADLRLRSEVVGLRSRDGRIEGAVLASGEEIATRTVIVAGGAWAGELGAFAKAPLPLRPFRRHIAQLDLSLPPATPVVWCLDDEAYFRAESGGALASPCDEDASEPCVPTEGPHARELLAEKLGRLAPRLAEAGVRRGWACLRTFAPDRNIVLGPDPRVAGLHWVAGLGGHGMSAGIATAELAVRALTAGAKVPDALGVARLLHGATPTPALPASP